MDYGLRVQDDEELTSGTKGGLNIPASSCGQLIFLKKICFLASSPPTSLDPSLLFTSF